MTEATCHCGAVRIETASSPQQVTDCNCSICRRLGTLWAYYRPAEVSVTGATDIYMWGTRSIEFHRCKICGNATHWSPADKGRERMGVNARLMAPEVLAAADVRRFDGAGL